MGKSAVRACCLWMLAGSAAAPAAAETVPFEPDPFPSTYQAPGAPPTLITDATVLDGLGGQLANTDVLLRDGQVAALGENLEAPEDARVIDAAGRWVTPGIVDVHSHVGMASVPYVPVELANWDVNEQSDPNTAHVRAENAIKPQDPAFERVLAGGVTTLQVLPGSTNLFGGRGVVLKNVPAATVQAMKFPGAPPSLKMACGENPKYTYGPEGRQPATRMGIMAGYRQAFEDARAYQRRWDAYRDDGGERPQRDLRLETLAGVLDGAVRVHVHCYTSQEMADLLDLADAYGFTITAFHHASEAYKIPGLLKEHGACGVVWADLWGFKMETRDAIRENAAFLEASGACVALHSDLPDIAQRLNIEAAKAAASGRRAGIDISRAEAFRWITSVPAKLLGLEDRIGSLEAGKNADVVVWSADPFSIRAHADLVFIDGAVVHDRSQPGPPRSDLELGRPALEARE